MISMSVKSFLITSFVTNCFIYVLCGQVNSVTSNQLINDNEKSEKINGKFVEGAIRVFFCNSHKKTTKKRAGIFCCAVFFLISDKIKLIACCQNGILL